jgi:CheY-like chemotaxis protein
MLATVDTCPACRQSIVPGDGGTFVDGDVIHLGCYVSNELEQHTGRGISRDSLLGIHVLIVDDRAATREMLRAALEYCGGFITLAASVDEGKMVLREIRPHVIVSDISMPDNGFELVRDVLAFAVETGWRIPAVAITGSRDSRQHAREAGFAAFITKPLDPFTLALVVGRLAMSRPRG